MAATDTIQNLVLNPRLASTATWSTSRVTPSGVSTGAPLDNGAYFHAVVSTVGTFPRFLTVTHLPWAVGETKTLSVYMRATAGQPLAIGGQFDGHTGTNFTEAITTATGAWQRLRITLTAPSDTTGAFAFWFGVPDNSALGTAFDVAKAMCSPGPLLFAYADGGSVGWSWTGTTSNSISQGPEGEPIGDTSGFVAAVAGAFGTVASAQAVSGFADAEAETFGAVQILHGVPVVRALLAELPVRTLTGAAPIHAESERCMIVKAGDRYPVTFTVSFDLTGSGVQVVARNAAGTTMELASTISDATNGKIQHILTGDLLAGEYGVVVHVSVPGVEQDITFPGDGLLRLIVEPNLEV